MSSSRGSSQHRDQTRVSLSLALQADSLPLRYQLKPINFKASDVKLLFSLD